MYTPEKEKQIYNYALTEERKEKVTSLLTYVTLVEYDIKQNLNSHRRLLKAFLS